MRIPAFAVLTCLLACNHTENFPTGPLEPLGPLGTGYQITFNAHGYGTPSWSADGQSVLYTYGTDMPDAVDQKSRCIGMVPSHGGSRNFLLCDVRATQRDSASLFSAVAFRPNGELLFLQSIGKPLATQLVRSKTLWLVDSARPLAIRRNLGSFPRTIGDTVIDYLTDVVWTDQNTFIGNGQRLLYPCTTIQCPVRDTIIAPTSLVRAELTDNAITWSLVAGTKGAAHWIRYGTGEILFVKGALNEFESLVSEDPDLLAVPVDGGAPNVVVSMAGRSIRGITCANTRCVVLSSNRVVSRTVFGSQLHILDRTTGSLTPVIAPGINLNLMKDPVISPDGSTLLYQMLGNLFRLDLP